MNTQTLKKTIWTDADFDELIWLDCKVHAFAPCVRKNSKEPDVLFDIDYSWWHTEPTSEGEKEYYLTSPATLVFKTVSMICLNSITTDHTRFGWYIVDIHKLGLAFEFDDEQYFKWQIQLENGNIMLEAQAFELIIKKEAIKTRYRELSDVERGHANFKRMPVKNVV